MGQHGIPHDLIIMELRMGTVKEDSVLTDPATYVF
jgi:hypothetical protein